MITKKKTWILLALVVSLSTAQTAFAAPNIDPGKKFSQFLTADIDNNSVTDLINWLPLNGGPAVGVTVTDNALTGFAWGPTVGWINFSPNGTGVTNTCDGELGGFAWGSGIGWINFSPSYATVPPSINTTTGEITGQVWSPQHGWIELASQEPGSIGLRTEWRPSDDCTDEPSPGGGGSQVIGTVPPQIPPTPVNPPVISNPTNPVSPTIPTLPTIPTVPGTNPSVIPDTPFPSQSNETIPTNQIPLVPVESNQSSPFSLGMNGLIVGAVVALVGLVSTFPGVATRVGNMLMTLVWGRKKLQGIVYDSKSKEPLDPVYVSVIDLTTNKEVKNQLTNMEGRFGFVLPKGHYKITAGKTNYVFPSLYLAGRFSDEVYDKLYFGEPFTVENEQQVVSMNIPMDPVGTDWNQKEKHRTSFLQYLMKGQSKYAWIFNMLFIIGFLASIMITYFYPIWWNYVMTSLYVVIGLMHVYGFGPVYAGKVTKNGNPLAGGIIRIWSATINHEVAKRVLEQSGAYYILVPKADYYVTIEERNADGTFTKIFTSEVFHANHGCIDKKFSL